MKKTLIALTTIIAIGSVVTSCKKGENDPFLSLRSRKARVVGEWKVVSATSEDVQTNGDKTTTTFDGTTLTEVDYDASNGSTNSSTSTQTEEWTFEKDYSFTYHFTTPSGMQMYEGSWAFMGKSKEGDVKKKENIGIRVLKYTYTPSVGAVQTSTYSGDQDFLAIFEINQLKNKEMIITTEEQNTDTYGSTIDKYSHKTSSTLQLK
jgi:hypothetical protein